jgi:hypothetical protein
MDDLVKQESSIPVQTRASMIALADLAKYWTDEGYRINTISQLVSWSLDLLREILIGNEKISDNMTVAEANRFLTANGLYQRSLRRRSFQKIGTAVRFESMRNSGMDPAMDSGRSYSVIHNKGSVRPSPNIEAEVGEDDPDWQKMKLEKQRAIFEENERIKQEAFKRMREQGVIVDENEMKIREEIKNDRNTERKS